MPQGEGNFPWKEEEQRTKLLKENFFSMSNFSWEQVHKCLTRKYLGTLCLNQTFFIPLKSFQNINNKYLKYLAFLI
jgi:hypothetical protein